MKKVNYHTHCSLCKHACGSLEDYVLSAIDNNLDILGFSDHGPFPNDQYGARMDYNDLDYYINTIDELKIKYRDEITIYAGLEIEYDPNFCSYYEDLINNRHIDYLNLGQHIFVNAYGNNINVFNLENNGSSAYYIDYANSISDALSSGYFSMIAHPDVIFINNIPWDSNCDKACDIIINAASKYNIPLEFNANGIRRGVRTYPDGERHPYPHIKFWNRVSNTDIPVIIGADCHNPNQIWDESVVKAYEIAKSFSLTIIDSIF